MLTAAKAFPFKTVFTTIVASAGDRKNQGLQWDLLGSGLKSFLDLSLDDIVKTL